MAVKKEPASPSLSPGRQRIRSSPNLSVIMALIITAVIMTVIAAILNILLSSNMLG